MTDRPTQPESEQIRQRRAKLEVLRQQGNAYPNDFRRDAHAGALHGEFGETDGQALASRNVRVRIAGRLMTRRIMGKASFADVRDESGRIQIFAQRDQLPEGVYNSLFKKLDLGDIVGVAGTMFRTKTGELSVRVDELQLLAKSLRPMPEKYHGLTDVEARYRQRYVDLMVNEESRETFRRRALIINTLRRFLDNRGYVEIESPIMHPIPGGANARPFVTHHNALGVDLYLRVAQELYIKRCLVGGFEKIYELNRNFRNEGLSTRHNPEFTMLEWNESYLDYVDYMDMTEEMIRDVVQTVTGEQVVEYQDTEIDLSGPFERWTMKQAVLVHNEGMKESDVLDRDALLKRLGELGIETDPGYSAGELLMELFEATVEEHLVQPTFITGYPLEVSPLSRCNEADPAVVDRFELFIATREIANGFSELNDPEEQATRLREQANAKAAGDLEAMYYDDDYITALEYGLPPNAGGGLGVDRLVMLLTDSASIRDVLLFPHMRPEG